MHCDYLPNASTSTTLTGTFFLYLRCDRHDIGIFPVRCTTNNRKIRGSFFFLLENMFTDAERIACTFNSELHRFIFVLADRVFSHNFDLFLCRQTKFVHHSGSKFLVAIANEITEGL